MISPDLAGNTGRSSACGWVETGKYLLFSMLTYFYLINLQYTEHKLTIYNFIYMLHCTKFFCIYVCVHVRESGIEVGGTEKGETEKRDWVVRDRDRARERVRDGRETE